ncbi:MAG TPA: AsmA family protein, partial [Steroidobacteraceae bacterium]|nr:AsmA family protein [Steroidobacteraceae bacterium]
MNTPLRKTLRVTGIVLGSLVAIVVAALALFDWNSLKHPIERIASAKLGRTVHIDGNLQAHIWSWTP